MKLRGKPTLITILNLGPFLSPVSFACIPEHPLSFLYTYKRLCICGLYEGLMPFVLHCFFFFLIEHILENFPHQDTLCPVPSLLCGIGEHRHTVACCVTPLLILIHVWLFASFQVIDDPAGMDLLLPGSQ